MVPNREQSKHYTFNQIGAHGYLHCDSPAGLVDFVNENRGEFSASTYNEELSWRGGLDLEGALSTPTKGGWLEGAEKVERLAVKVRDIKQPRKVSRRKVVGQRPHVGAYLAGSPRAMRKRQLDPTVQTPSKRVVSIAFCLSRSGATSTGAIENFGGAVVSAIRTLEKSNRRVRVIAYFEAADQTITITVKKPDQPLNVPMLMFMLAHPAASRTLRFAANDIIYRKHGCHHGMHTHNGVELTRSYAKQGYIVFSRVIGNGPFSTREGAEKHVEEVCAAALDGELLFSHNVEGWQV